MNVTTSGDASVTRIIIIIALCLPAITTAVLSLVDARLRPLISHKLVHTADVWSPLRNGINTTTVRGRGRRWP